jgi:histidine decarboxylase
MKKECIPALENGEIDYDLFNKHLQKSGNKNIIFAANIGTTMTEAKDDLNKINNILDSNNIVNKIIHCDAALSGSFLPLIDSNNLCSFKTPNVKSIAISGHKFIGSPMPCGVVVVDKQLQQNLSANVDYVGANDCTITGSRNGHTPLFMHDAVTKHGLDGFKNIAINCIQNAQYATEKLQQNGIKAWRNNNAITVVFPKMPQYICTQWQLASDATNSHIICMPNITKEKIDAFVESLQ